MRRIGLTCAAAALLAVVTGAAPAQEFATGDIVVSNAWMRANLRASALAPVYFDLRLTGEEPDALVGATSAVAGAVEIRGVVTISDVMRSVELDEIPIPPGEYRMDPVAGIRLVLLRAPVILEGETVPVTLLFARHGALAIQVPVLDVRADGPN